MSLFKLTLLKSRLLTLLIVFCGCNSEVAININDIDTVDTLQIQSLVMSSDNSHLEVKLNQPVYGDSTNLKAVDASCFELSVNKKTGNVETVNLLAVTKLNDSPLTGGDIEFKLDINLLNTPTGDEVISLELVGDCIFLGSGIVSDQVSSDLSVSPVNQTYSTLNYNWVAFNDSSETSTGNVTSLGLIGSTASVGALVKNVDNSISGITATLTGTNIAGWNLDTSPSSGTDAFDLFNGKINLSGLVSYVNSSLDSFHQLDLSGLSVGKSYAVFFYANRDKIAYAGTDSSSRWSLFTLSGSESAVNTSGLGTVEISENQIKLNSGFNTDNGALVGWSKIKTSTGNITIRSENMGVSGPGEANKTYGFQAFALMELAD